MRIENGLIVDLFAGGGGASAGIHAATGRDVSIAINHSPIALAVHSRNHQRTLHLATDIWDVDPVEAAQGIPVDILWMSPDCTHFSVAKGGQPRKQGIRSLADVGILWARKVRPRVIFLENVQEFLGWGPLAGDGHPIVALKGSEFQRWRAELEALGYVVDYRVLVASHFGAPTSRKRLFLVARCDGQPIVWPEATHGPGKLPFHTAGECIDWSLPCPSIFDRKKPLRPKTLARIAEGMRRFVFESASPYVVDNAAQFGIQRGYGERVGQTPRTVDLNEPLGTVVAQGSKHALVSAFLAAHYGGEVGTPLNRPIRTVTSTDHHSLVTASLDGAQPNRAPEVRAFLASYFGSAADIGQPIGAPLRTITTRDRFGLVTVDGIDRVVTDIGMRMLQPHELLRAQFGRFAEGYDMSDAVTKTAKVRLIGNSVCPEVAEAVVAANLPWAAEAAA